jgi:hypothetical protein
MCKRDQNVKPIKIAFINFRTHCIFLQPNSAHLILFLHTLSLINYIQSLENCQHIIQLLINFTRQNTINHERSQKRGNP